MLQVHRVSYSIGIAGEYLLHVRLRQAAAELPGSPFLLRVEPGAAFAASSSLPRHVLHGHVVIDSPESECAEYVMSTADRMGNKRTSGGEAVVVSCAAAGVGATCIDRGDGTYVLRWSSTKTGVFRSHVTIGGLPVGGSPCTVRFESTQPDLGRCEIGGEGIRSAIAREPATVIVRFRDAHDNVVAPHGRFRGATRFGVALMSEKDVRAMAQEKEKGAAKSLGLAYVLKHNAIECATQRHAHTQSAHIPSYSARSVDGVRPSSCRTVCGTVSTASGCPPTRGTASRTHPSRPHSARSSPCVSSAHSVHHIEVAAPCAWAAGTRHRRRASTSCTSSQSSPRAGA